MSVARKARFREYDNWNTREFEAGRLWQMAVASEVDDENCDMKAPRAEVVQDMKNKW